jgi:hypothetical protein
LKKRQTSQGWRLGFLVGEAGHIRSDMADAADQKGKDAGDGILPLFQSTCA